jgi:DNA-binding XRE family transcriptional regulator
MDQNRNLSASTLDHAPDSVAGVPYRSDRPATIRRREQVGDRLRSLRRAQGISQRALADQVGIDVRSIGALENGTKSVTLDAVLDLADALKVPITWLFTDDWSTPDGGGSGGGEAP